MCHLGHCSVIWYINSSHACTLIASHADVLRLVMHPSPRTFVGKNAWWVLKTMYVGGLCTVPWIFLTINLCRPRWITYARPIFKICSILLQKFHSFISLRTPELHTWIWITIMQGFGRFVMFKIRSLKFSSEFHAMNTRYSKMAAIFTILRFAWKLGLAALFVNSKLKRVFCLKEQSYKGLFPRKQRILKWRLFWNKLYKKVMIHTRRLSTHLVWKMSHLATLRLCLFWGK